MAKAIRSLSATKTGLELAKEKLRRFSSKTAFAGVAQVSRATVQKFFVSQPIGLESFQAICKTLELNWEQIAGLADEPRSESKPVEAELKSLEEIEALVQQMRQQIQPYIQERCGKMRVLDMEQPVALAAIYTNVNILERLTGYRGLGLAELLKSCNWENFDRLGMGKIQDDRIDGLEAVQQHSKLLVLGKPGAGKSTFLKRLAVLCCQGKFQSDCVPIFITLKEFAETEGKPTLIRYINRLVSTSSQTILNAGRALILLDGLDEVKDADHNRIIRQIRQFSERFSQNQFVMTCRIAAQEYTFEQFTEVEVADFDRNQIQDFVTKWFETKQDPVKVKTFMEKLENNKPIEELATSPLLLTLLCLLFGESNDFPANRSELYEEALEVLLRKWDAKRNIERDRIYKKLSRQRKEDLLSLLAYRFFERGEYFFKQKVVTGEIVRFIRNLPGASEDEETLEVDGESVLRSIEAQHGLLIERARNIYSFSHLTFLEYFTARQIKERWNDEILKDLVSHITEKRWREVFLLSIGMLPDANEFLQSIKAQVDNLLSEDEKLQKFLIWINQKSLSDNILYKLSATRALYFTSAYTTSGFALNININFSDINSYSSIKGKDIFSNLSSFGGKVRSVLSASFYSSYGFSISNEYRYSYYVIINYDFHLAWKLDPPTFRVCTQLLKELGCQNYLELSENFQGQAQIQKWMQDNEQVWIEQCQELVKNSAIIGDWQFDNEQEELLQRYYDANLLLVDCLNLPDIYVSREVRQEIEETLLLPIEEINKRRKI